MQSIVKGIMYDTDASILIYHDENRKRKYYMTPHSRFFIMFGTGEIQPMSSDAMKEFLGKNDIAKYKDIFGEPIEG